MNNQLNGYEIECEAYKSYLSYYGSNRDPMLVKMYIRAFKRGANFMKTYGK